MLTVDGKQKPPIELPGSVAAAGVSIADQLRIPGGILTAYGGRLLLERQGAASKHLSGRGRILVGRIRSSTVVPRISARR